MKRFLSGPVGIIFVSVLTVFALSRLIAYLIIVLNVLPTSLFLTFGAYRLHHFVYGNILIVATSFYVLALQKKPTRLIYLFYGIGLGLVLDEFPLWMGDVGELSRKIPIIPLGAIATIIFLLILVVVYKRTKIE